MATYRSLRNVRGFFSDYYLGSVFGQGGRRRRLSDRQTLGAYKRFLRIRQEAEGRAPDAPLCRERFLRPLLRDVLGFHLGAGETRLHLLYASAEAEASEADPLLALYCGEWDEDLDAGGKAGGPRRDLEAALAREGLRHGLLVTGERLRLLRTPGDGPRGAFLEVDLAGLAEGDDPESFAAFYRLLHRRGFLPGESGTAPIEQVERESSEHAARVSDDLKAAVFSAAEHLVQGLLEDAAAAGRTGETAELAEDDLLRFRDAALTALYRILFIMYAEARDPRLERHPLYRDSYSIQGLVDQILHRPLEDWPANRVSLWSRLRALFRIYDEGLPRISPWEHIPPRGGDFFRPGTPEGEILDQARLTDQVVARVVLALATTPPRRGVGHERVSFRELDIENLGAVYEGLLEYEPRMARETSLEVRVPGIGPVHILPATEVVRLCATRDLRLEADPALVDGTPVASLLLEESGDETEEGGRTGRGGRASWSRRAPARVLRRLERGRFHFVPGPARKGSGSFYTPLPLVEDLVEHAVGPLAAGRSAAEIERLRVLDPACGSAHFLVQAMRFLGRELHRALVEEHGGKSPPHFRSTGETGWDDDWRASDEEARLANSEARAWCKRRIAERCLFGVDLSPTAVALAHIALWIESVAGDRPLTYFEHHVRCGNSLLGTWLRRLDRPPVSDMRGGDGPEQPGLYQKIVREAVEEAARARALIDETAPEALLVEGVEPESLEEMAFKERQRERAEETLASARLLFDLRSASAFLAEIWGQWETLCSLLPETGCLEEYARSQAWWDRFEEVRCRERFFHWELEFPEVFLDRERPGFDAVLGNPPWDKVLPTKHEFYARHDVLIRAFKGNALDRRIRELHAEHPGVEEAFTAYRARTRRVAQVLRKGGDFPLSKGRSQAAHEDVSKYFVDRAARLVASGGRAGLVVPSVLYNGDGCLRIRRFLLEKARIERFYGFENRRKVFPIDSRYKFVNLAFRKGASGKEEFQAAFMRHDLSELSDDRPKPWMVTIRHDEVRRLSPESLAFLEYRSPRDQEIVRRMSEGRPALGGDGPGSWGVDLITDLNHVLIYNSARDKDLWTDPGTGRLHTPRSVLGKEPDDFGETLRRMRERGFWPVFEGKHVEQHLLGIKPVRWWLSIEQAKQKYGKEPLMGPTLVYRETASNTNERTCISLILPPRSTASHKLSGLLLERVDPGTAAAVLDSLCFDYALRLRTAGTNVSFTYMRPMPIPTSERLADLPRVQQQFAWEKGISHITEDQEVWPDLWAVERAVAEAYGLGPDDFEHILASFPVLARKRKEYVAYLEGRLADWKAGTEEASPVAVAVPSRVPKRRKATGHQRYNQAAILAFVVDALEGSDLGRTGHDKVVYFAQESLDVALGLDFQRRAYGPWDSDLKYKLEPLAERQGWVIVEGGAGEGAATALRPGPRIAVGLAQARKRYGKKIIEIEALCTFFKERRFVTVDLERWATIHKCWKDLQAQGRPVTEDRLVAEVRAWKEHYGEGEVRSAIRGLLSRGLIHLDEEEASSGA